MLALKQGIEAAQRGLRRASDAESPYALSDQSRPGKGFTPAKPATLIAENSKQTKSENRSPKTTPPGPASVLGSDGDEQGDPIRLASGETPISAQAAAAIPGPTSADHTNAPALAHSESEAPMAMPESPTIPTVSRLPDLTEANGSDRLVGADDQNTAPKAKPAVIDLETVPSSAPAGNTGQPVDPGAPLHTETEGAVLSSLPSSVQAGPADQPTTAPALVAASPANDEVPVLPADLSRSAPEARATDAPATQPTPAAAPAPVAAADDELPPLPADLGRAAQDSPASVTTPVQTTYRFRTGTGDRQRPAYSARRDARSQRG